MKICVIGNSHAVNLRQSIGSKLELGGHKVDFYLMPGGMEPHLKFTDGCLFPVSAETRLFTTVRSAESGGLRIAEFDAFVIAACGWFAARNIFVEKNPLSHPLATLCCAEWIDDQSDDPRCPQIVSAAVFGEVVKAYIRNHPATQTAFLLAEHFAGPVALQPWPAPSRRLRSAAYWFVNTRFGKHGARAWLDFFKAQHAALTSVTEELGARFTLLDYPLAGPLQDGFMSAEWCDNKDPWHANERYGKGVCQQIIRLWR